MAAIANAPVFIVAYLVFMVPTYVLPWLGSNSAVLTGAGLAAGVLSPLFAIHAVALLVLIALAWLRGAAFNIKWLAVFPVVAAAFDLLPTLNLIPFVPTVMHVLCLVLGVVKAQAPVPVRN